MADQNRSNDELELFFAAARQEARDWPEGLNARILADAAAVQTPAKTTERVAVPGKLRQLLGTLGGWPGMGGLVAACAAGLWIGVAPPAFLPDPVALVGGSQSAVNLLDTQDVSALLAEDP